MSKGKIVVQGNSFVGVGTVVHAHGYEGDLTMSDNFMHRVGTVIDLGGSKAELPPEVMEAAAAQYKESVGQGHEVAVAEVSKLDGVKAYAAKHHIDLMALAAAIAALFAG